VLHGDPLEGLPGSEATENSLEPPHMAGPLCGRVDERKRRPPPEERLPRLRKDLVLFEALCMACMCVCVCLAHMQTCSNFLSPPSKSLNTPQGSYLQLKRHPQLPSQHPSSTRTTQPPLTEHPRLERVLSGEALQRAEDSEIGEAEVLRIKSAAVVLVGAAGDLADLDRLLGDRLEVKVVRDHRGAGVRRGRERSDGGGGEGEGRGRKNALPPLSLFCVHLQEQQLHFHRARDILELLGQREDRHEVRGTGRAQGELPQRRGRGGHCGAPVTKGGEAKGPV
jgi:hypothetical protein